jgi:hypothetical protein
MSGEVLDRIKPRFDEPVRRLMNYDAAERRLVGRLLSYWHDLCDGRTYPSLKDIDPERVGSDWRWSFILETGDHREFPNFLYLGPDLAKYSGIFLAGQDDFTTTLLDVATHKLDRVFREGCPLLMEDVVTLFDGQRLMYRAVLLPLSDDGDNINFVLGAANGRMED